MPGILKTDLGLDLESQTAQLDGCAVRLVPQGGGDSAVYLRSVVQLDFNPETGHQSHTGCAVRLLDTPSASPGEDVRKYCALISKNDTLF